MKIQILSDLHLEHGNKPQLNDFECVGDVLVLAGDICGSKSKRRVHEVFGKIKKKPIVYVMGNHEYYGGHIERTLAEFREWFGMDYPQPNIKLLENGHFDYEGVRFIGSTYWSHPSIAEELEVKRCIADFKVIEGHSIDLQRNLRHQAQSYIKWAAEEGRAKGLKVVVVTHFPPSWQAREERFKTSALGSYFYNDDDEFVSLVGPDIWIYGHTHGNLRFKCGEVPVVCNQMGYTQNFSNGMQVEACYKDFALNYLIEI